MAWAILAGATCPSLSSGLHLLVMLLASAVVKFLLPLPRLDFTLYPASIRVIMGHYLAAGSSNNKHGGPASAPAVVCLACNSSLPASQLSPLALASVGDLM